MNRYGVNVAYVNLKSINQSNVDKFISSLIERLLLNDTHLIKVKIEVSILETDKDKKTSSELIMTKSYCQRQQIWLRLVLIANY